MVILEFPNVSMCESCESCWNIVEADCRKLSCLVWLPPCLLFAYCLYYSTVILDGSTFLGLSKQWTYSSAHKCTACLLL
jgi:hypothetical protein